MSDAAGQPDVGDGGEYVRLDVPATTEQLRLVRLVVVGLATSHGADVDDLEDLRIATGEICAHLVAHSRDDARLVVDASIDGSVSTAVRVTATVRSGAATSAAEPLDELSEMVLATTTRAFGVDADADATVAWFERSVHVPAQPLGSIRPDA